jgi:hypothetical protein
LEKILKKTKPFSLDDYIMNGLLNAKPAKAKPAKAEPAKKKPAKKKDKA